MRLRSHFRMPRGKPNPLGQLPAAPGVAAFLQLNTGLNTNVKVDRALPFAVPCYRPSVPQLGFLSYDHERLDIGRNWGLRIIPQSSTDLGRSPNPFLNK